MKLLIFSLVLLLSGAEAFAVNTDSLRYEVICEEGLKFLVVFSVHKSSSPTVTQIMTASEIAGGPPQPLKCNR